MAESDDIEVLEEVNNVDYVEYEMTVEFNDHDYCYNTQDDPVPGPSRPTSTISGPSGAAFGGKTQKKIDTFIVKKSDPHHFAKNITASDRAKMNPNQLHESGGKLFCTVCNIVLDHLRVFAIKQHFLTKKHLSRASGILNVPERTRKVQNQIVEQRVVSTASDNSKKEPVKQVKQQTITHIKKQTEAATTRYEVKNILFK